MSILLRLINKHVLITVILLNGACTYGMGFENSFTVRTSIEMTRFSDQGDPGRGLVAQTSPDGKYVAVLTSRGVLASNEIQTSIWLFSIAQIRNALKTQTRVMPKLLTQWGAIPVTEVYSAYTSVISSVHWAMDSRSIYFLAVESNGRRRLCRVDVETGRIHRLSSESSDVTMYSMNRNHLVYTAVDTNSRALWVQRSSSAVINADAMSVTGRSITDILFPTPTDDRLPKIHTLWMVHGDIAQVVVTSPPPQPDLEHFWDVLSVSPDGRYAVQLRPFESVARSWENFAPVDGFEDWITHLRHTDASDYHRPSQYVLIDLESGSVRPLIDAPYAASLAYLELARVRWSVDGRRVLLTGTFLPFEDKELEAHIERTRPCAVVSVDLDTRKAHCIVSSRDGDHSTPGNPNPLRVEEESFGSTENDVILRFGWRKPPVRTQTEQYHYYNGRWKLVSCVMGDAEPTSPDGWSTSIPPDISVSVKQGLNDPPVLWATDGRSGKHAAIWDPNPEFASMAIGETSVFHWKDKTGFEWTGGLVKPVNYIPGYRYPLVIQTHGFADSEFMTDGIFPSGMAARPLSSAGIMVLQVLGSTAHLLQLQEAEDNVAGYLAAIDSLALTGMIDPKRVGIVGFSRTCWYVEDALVTQPGRFIAASFTDGTAHSYMQSMLFDLGRVSEAQKIYSAKPFGEGLKSWLDEATTFKLDRINAPVLITAIGQGSVLEEWELYSSLYQQGKPVDLIYIPDGQHILQKPLDRLASQQLTVDWFRFWLQGYERPHPEDVTQYVRWRHLRAIQGP